MDNWGDPWADANHNNSNNNDTPESPTKQQVVKAARTTADPQPFLSNVWDDDAQWGTNDDDGVGGWASEVQPVGAAGLPIPKSLGWGDESDTKDDNDDNDDEHTPVKGIDEGARENNEWDMVHEDARTFRDSDNGISEKSDSATTIQPDEAPARIANDFGDSLHPDDDLSTRPSMSSFDLSPNGTTTESPRTSFEEERAGGRTRETEKDDDNGIHESGSSVKEEVQPHPTGMDGADDDRSHNEEQLSQEAVEPKQDAQSVNSAQTSPNLDAGAKHREPAESPTAQSKHELYPIDADLMSQLFPLTKKASKELEEAPDDPVHCSSGTRKAWYRLIRRQTMREYNSDQDYDKYIRVTWKTSTIRTEVNKTVLRWVNEDRMAGRGPGARISFYWDTPAPPDQKTPFHSRQRSSAAVSNPIKSSAKEVQPLSTDVPAAFSWSSPSVTNDPWKDTSTDVRSSSSPMALPKHIAVAKLQRQEGRGGSVDLSPRPREPAIHKRTATSMDLPRTAAIIPPPPPVSQSPQPLPNDHANPWAGLDALDTSTPPRQEAAPEDDDDEWGEMVESPAVSIANTTFDEPPEPSTRQNTLSTPATTPPSVKTSPLQSHLVQTGSKHASPIVRLKGTVSPTSTVFKPNAFVPASVEQGPIGPSLLKSRSASAQSATNKTTAPPPPVAQLDEVLNAEPSKPPTPKESVPHKEDDEFSTFESSTPGPATSPSTPTTPTPAPPPSNPLTTTTTSSWADGADFSIFESSIPQTTLPPTLSSSTPDPTDPWSIFNTPPPPPVSGGPTEESPSHTHFARPVPKSLTPPAQQPLTTATSSAQRRKIEEDELVRSIIEGLPDLSYMIRR
ncbi:hypothetical protein DM02DRAFT_187592 [Periconia macrospinosa]|uniref:Uncharacterized protein n=1 Tax=Periconia macrospinosa TaxID=97972 RepID=A0A2V1E1S6_9PLEO|nr:hypothetical protein DM02DRAFT_187592 [Periconia macrospinosa]